MNVHRYVGERRPLCGLASCLTRRKAAHGLTQRPVPVVRSALPVFPTAQRRSDDDEEPLRTMGNGSTPCCAIRSRLWFVSPVTVDLRRAGVPRGVRIFAGVV